MTIHKFDIAECLQACEGHWSPNTPTQFNGYDITILKIIGEMIWTLDCHHDRLFLLLEGQMRIQLDDGWVALSKGEFCVVSKGTNHRPIANSESHIILINFRSSETKSRVSQTPEMLH